MSTTTLAAALAYTCHGLAVFPATAAAKKSHKSAEHSNGAKWGATADPAEVRSRGSVGVHGDHKPRKGAV